MKINRSLVVSTAIIVLNIFSLFLFHSVPVQRLWTGFHTLAVSRETDEQTVLSILSNYGCKDVVSLSFQKSFLSPYCPVYKLPDDVKDYNKLKKNFFFDKAEKFQVYYVPEEYTRELERAYRILINNYHISVTLDSQVVFPWLTPLLCLIFAVVLSFFLGFSKFFIFSAVFPLLFTLSQPFFVHAGGAALILLGFAFFSGLRRRKGCQAIIAKSIFSAIFFIIPIILISLASFSAGLLMLLSLASSLAAEQILYFAEQKVHQKQIFQRVLILPADCISLQNRSFIKMPAACMILTGLFLFQYVMTSRFLPSSADNDLLLPAPARYNGEDNLVSLSDCIEWKWFQATYPYRSLYEKNGRANFGDKVIIPRYEQTSDGIKQTNEIVFIFDDAFKESVLNEIDSLSDTSLEKMLKKQGKNDAASYSPAGKTSGAIHEFFILVIEFLTASLLLFFLMMSAAKNDKAKAN